MWMASACRFPYVRRRVHPTGISRGSSPKSGATSRPTTRCSGGRRDRAESAPAAEVVVRLDQHDVVLLQHRQQPVLELLLPQLALVELVPQRSAALEGGEAAHEEEGVGVVQREKRAPDAHADPL